jgi:hypothetical protein
MDKSHSLDKDIKTSDSKNIKLINTETKPLILCPFGFYNYISYMLPHPDYPDNLDMY